MKKSLTKISFLIVSMLMMYTQNGIAQFWTETFSDQAAAEAAWTSGGTNAGTGGQVWTWTNDPGNPTFGTQPDFASTTATDGFFQFNSDGNGNGAHDVTLTSSMIDCSGQAEVWLQSQHQYGFFSNVGVSIAEVGVSTDGTNFTYIPILTDVAQNDLEDAVQFQYTDLSAVAANQAQVWIQFRWQGNFEYAWKIDDLELYPSNPTPATPDNDLELVEFFVAPSAATPMSQADTVFFGGFVSNNGLVDQTNVTLSYEVSKNGASLYSSSTNIGTLAAGAMDSIWYEGEYFNSDTGAYTITYDLSADAMDANMLDNSASTVYEITESLWAKEDGTGISTVGADDVTRQGTLYDYFNDGDYAAVVQIVAGGRAGNSLEGQTVTVRVQSTDFGLTPYDDDNLTTNGQSSYTFTADDEANSPSIINIPILNTQSGCIGVDLDPDKVYAVTVEYDDQTLLPYGSESHNYQFQGESAVILRQPDATYFGGWTSGTVPIVRMVVTDEPEVELAPEANFAAAPDMPMSLTVNFQSTSIFGCDLLWDFGDSNSSFSENPSHTYSEAGTYNVCLTASNDFNMDGDVFCQEITVGGAVSTVDLADLNTIEIAPNPVKDVLRLNVEMTEVAQTANIRIVDVAGKVLVEENYNNVLTQTFTYGMQQFAAGSYILHMTTEAGTTAQKFTVQK